MIGISVKGGTGAGRKVQKQPTLWEHMCQVRDRVVADGAAVMSWNYNRSLTSYSCPDCGARRPEH